MKDSPQNVDIARQNAETAIAIGIRRYSESFLREITKALQEKTGLKWRVDVDVRITQVYDNEH